MAYVRIYFDSRKEKKDDTCAIKIVVLHIGDIRFTTGVSVSVDEWSGKELSKKVEKYKTKNSIPLDKLYKIKSIVF
jgi:hypothetical protein